MLKDICNTVKSFWQDVRQVLQKQLPTKEHEDAWKLFERALAIRCNITFVSKVVYMIVMVGIGRANFQTSSNYIDAGEEHNEALVESSFNFLKIVLIVMSLGRIPLIAISFKYSGICRFYFYYQVVYASLEWCLPRDYGAVATNVLFSDNVLNFCLLYYDFWPSCLG